MSKELEQLKEILGEISDINNASAVLGWDQQTYMPPMGAEARGQAQGTLDKIAHEKFTSAEVGKLLDALEKQAGDWDPDSDEARLVAVTRRHFDKDTKVPSRMVAERAELTTMGNQAWQEARIKSDFPIFEPHLEKLVDWARRFAELYAPYDHVYDPMLDIYEPGMKAKDVKVIFDDIRPKQVDLIKRISEAQQVDDSVLHQPFDEKGQWDFGVGVVTDFGYDWKQGRLDKTTHPFQTTLGWGDHRITTRVYPDFFNPYFFGTLHEAGHAMHAQGVAENLKRTPLYNSPSLAIGESQSRMWENLVGRSKPFWEHYFPKLQKVFPEQLKGVDMETFYKAINKVAPSYIRVEADEATYNLHIMLRMELEMAIMEGEAEIKKLPMYWSELFTKYLGVTPPNDKEGVLQDVHWSFGLMGYFSTYALGNLVSAQLWEVIGRDIPDIENKIRTAEFAPLLQWLNKHVHAPGAKFEPQVMVERITGSKINGDAYIRYLEKKFTDIYGL
ncbi:MAG: carboxypeptidase M32 [Anaerolineales bacterium]|nr:MAG: carboxypeptidase M32 [Anaerolineales bacterium]